MALSNIFREPRREITEQVIGTISIILFVAADYGILEWLGGWHHNYGLLVLSMLLIGCGMILIPVVVFGGCHVIGELVCAGLDAAGLDPRPRNRY
jgi:hypothetical protein